MNIEKKNDASEEHCNELEDSKVTFVTNEDFTKEFLTNFNLEKAATNLLNGTFVIHKFRHIYWCLMLGLLQGDDVKDWISALTRHRRQYQTSYDKNQIKAENLTKLDPQIFHPLSHFEQNPWILKQKNEELLEEIWKDIERTFPEMSFFANYKIRKSLQRILFVWCKENPDVGYKQGMNELLAVIYLMFARNKVKNYNETANCNPNDFCLFFCSEDHIESDTYTFFNLLMETYLMKSMFLTSANSSSTRGIAVSTIKTPLNTNPFGVSSEQTQPQSAVLFRCANIFHKILKNAYPLVFEHLQSLHVEPQLFLLRWVRLLFSREFHIEDTVVIWDFIFADAYLMKSINCLRKEITDPKKLGIQASSALPLVDYFAIAMIAFVRHYLLDSDSSGCLRRLLHFPPLESVFPLVQIALQTRESSLGFNSLKSLAEANNNNNSASSLSSTASFSNDIFAKEAINSTNSVFSKAPVFSASKSNHNNIQAVLHVSSFSRQPAEPFHCPLSSSAKKEEIASCEVSSDLLQQKARDTGEGQHLLCEISTRLNEIFKRLSKSVNSSDDCMLRKEVNESLRDISLLNKIVQETNELCSGLKEKKDFTFFEKSVNLSSTSFTSSKSLLSDTIPTLLLCSSASSSLERNL